MFLKCKEPKGHGGKGGEINVGKVGLNLCIWSQNSGIK